MSINVGNIIQIATEALSLIEQGRAALASVRSAVADGTAALDATTQAQLDQLLATEAGQTHAAIADLRSAITQFRAG